jgi:HJR/Mrr/RecB family endonuclease
LHTDDDVTVPFNGAILELYLQNVCQPKKNNHRCAIKTNQLLTLVEVIDQFSLLELMMVDRVVSTHKRCKTTRASGIFSQLVHFPHTCKIKHTQQLSPASSRSTISVARVRITLAPIFQEKQIRFYLKSKSRRKNSKSNKFSNLHQHRHIDDIDLQLLA